MNIIFIAPPAAGKGTQANLLCSKYNMKHISTGDLIRETINNDSPLSQELKDIMNQGKLVSDEFILDLIKLNLKDDDYIFDGFPRTVKQAEMFDELLATLNKKVDYVIYLKISKDLASKRILGRISCPNCGSVYNDQIEAIMPKQKGLCDVCNTQLEKRNDDNIETFTKRFDTYIKETEPLLEYYKDKLYEIDSSKDKEEIFKEIEGIINDNN